MKRLIVLFCAVALLFSFACAEGFETPVLQDPKTQYETYFEQTDGSEMSLFMMMDFMNDEAKIVEEHGALKIIMNMLDENGEVVQTVDNYLQMSDFGRMQIIEEAGGFLTPKVYCVGGKVYTSLLGQIQSADAYPPEEFETLWESYKFPYGPLDILHGVRQDEVGNTYVLVRSDDMRTFEYAMTGSMEIVEIRVYETNIEGVLTLVSIATYETCEALEIPRKIYDAIAADFAPAEE